MTVLMFARRLIRLCLDLNVWPSPPGCNLLKKSTCKKIQIKNTLDIIEKYEKYECCSGYCLGSSLAAMASKIFSLRSIDIKFPVRTQACASVCKRVPNKEAR